ncbi:MAG: peptidase S10 [Gammaproteobacteria bacterium]
MSNDKSKDRKKKKHKAPKGITTDHKLGSGDEKLEYKATAEWIVLNTNEKPRAEMFHISYIKKCEPSSERPVTFVFNGGPGASSAYLHVGAIGPKRVLFNEEGTPKKPPVKLVDNQESWLAFTDLVFVDPIGTGFSRTIEEPDQSEKPDAAKKSDEQNQEFYKLKRDLESLGEFIQKYLSRNKRWDSPVFIAGESYGGFRVGKLARLLQEGYGVGLNGAILISPALEWALLDPSDYDLLHWTDTVPTMALAARHHGRSRVPSETFDELKQKAETFATTDLTNYLVQGARFPQEETRAVLKNIADFLGLEQDFVDRFDGRVPMQRFCRELLKDTREVCGFYDATVKAVDPFPDRDTHQAPDPTLFAIERVFAGGINTQIRQNLKLETDRDYRLLSMDVNSSWKVDTQTHAFELQVGATDDLRYAMSLNPYMKVFITHGLYDMVTPYFSSDRLVDHMKLTGAQKQNLTVEHYKGGHMFYAWEASRVAFTDSIKAFYDSAL